MGRENDAVSAQPGPAPAHPSTQGGGRHAGDDPRAILARPLAATSLLDAVRDLRRDVEATSFPLDVPGAESARASRVRLVDQLGEHLVPRLTELSAPALVVVSGSTGAGKSTLVNSLVGTEVSAAGVLRPTTRRPVLVHNPQDADLLSHHPVLESVEVVAHESVPRGIAVLDAPDLDSVLESNRESAHRLLEAADLWLFVTTAARYGDALPWRVLQDAVARHTTIAMVLNRVAPESLPTVRGDLLERLRSHGLQGAPLFVVPDVGPHQGVLPPAVVAPIRRWLTMLAGPDRARTVVARTLRGALDALRPWVDELADAVQEQADAASVIGARLDEATVAPRRRAQEHVGAGSVADGAVRARWAELTASGAPLARVVRPSGRVRGSSRSARSREAAVAPLLRDLVAAVTSVLVASGERAEEAVHAAMVDAQAPAGSASVAVGDDGVTQRVAVAQHAARGWVAQGERALHAALGAQVAAGARAARRRRRARRVVGDPVLAALALTAAAGVGGASDLLGTLLGTAGTVAVQDLRGQLSVLTENQVDLERAALDAVLRQPDLAADAASTLRLRLAVLKALT